MAPANHEKQWITRGYFSPRICKSRRIRDWRNSVFLTCRLDSFGKFSPGKIAAHGGGRGSNVNEFQESRLKIDCASSGNFVFLWGEGIRRPAEIKRR